MKNPVAFLLLFGFKFALSQSNEMDSFNLQKFDSARFIKISAMEKNFKNDYHHKDSACSCSDETGRDEFVYNYYTEAGKKCKSLKQQFEVNFLNQQCDSTITYYDELEREIYTESWGHCGTVYDTPEPGMLALFCETSTLKSVKRSVYNDPGKVKKEYFFLVLSDGSMLVEENWFEYDAANNPVNIRNKIVSAAEFWK